MHSSLVVVEWIKTWCFAWNYEVKLGRSFHSINVINLTFRCPQCFCAMFRWQPAGHRQVVSKPPWALQESHRSRGALRWWRPRCSGSTAQLFGKEGWPPTEAWTLCQAQRSSRCSGGSPAELLGAVGRLCHTGASAGSLQTYWSSLSLQRWVGQ